MNTPDSLEKVTFLTGERAIEGMAPPPIPQKIAARCQFASHYARRRVLDFACGTGYG